MATPLDYFHYHIVNIDFQVLSYLVGEHGAHELLVGNTCVLKAKRHGIIVIFITRHECLLGSIHGIHLNHIVP